MPSGEVQSKQKKNRYSCSKFFWGSRNEIENASQKIKCQSCVMPRPLIEAKMKPVKMNSLLPRSLKSLSLLAETNPPVYRSPWSCLFGTEAGHRALRTPGILHPSLRLQHPQSTELITSFTAGRKTFIFRHREQAHSSGLRLRGNELCSG